MGYYDWRPYVPVGQRRAKAQKQMDKLRKKGRAIEPVEITGRAIATTFWGKAWCDHLELFSDYANRLPRGRTYVRNGSVCHLAITKGRIEAIVSGSALYNVSIRVRPLKPAAWKAIKGRCAGRIGSMLELLQGKLSEHVMGVVTDPKEGLMPRMGEMELECSCPDWADMCKHVAAVLYGVGSRLDHQPELLFTLRGVKAEELISTEIRLPAAGGAEAIIADDQLADVFGIELEEPTAAPVVEARPNVKFPADKAAERRKHAAIKNAAQPVLGKKKPAKRKATGTIRTGPSAKAKKAWTGKSVTRLRKRLGLSVEQMAEQLGMSAAIVRRWENTPGKLNLQNRSRQALDTLAETASS